MDMWEGILGQGYDDIIYIPMSSGLSESCNSAKVLPKIMTAGLRLRIITEFPLPWNSQCMMRLNTQSRE